MVIRVMNWRHSGVTDWGLRHISIKAHHVILDVGCGGGRTVAKLAVAARDGVVQGIDYSEECVAAARRLNRTLVADRRVDIQQAPVSRLPFADDTFDLATAIETHFWWPDLGAGLREVRRVLKPGGRLLVVAEFYNGGKHARFVDRLSRWTTMAMLTVEQHRTMLTDAGFAEVEVVEEARRGWICAVAVKR